MSDRQIVIEVPYDKKETIERFLNTLKTYDKYDMYNFHYLIDFYQLAPYVRTIGTFTTDENPDILTERYYWEWNKEAIDNCQISVNKHGKYEMYELILPYPLLDNETIDDLGVDFYGYSIEQDKSNDSSNENSSDSWYIIFKTKLEVEAFLHILHSYNGNILSIDDMKMYMEMAKLSIIKSVKYSCPSNGLYGWRKEDFYDIKIEKTENETYKMILPFPQKFDMEIDSMMVSLKDIKNKIVDGGERISYGEGKAIREPSTGKGRFDLITPFGLSRIARWYELGAMKYADRNWEKGIPFSRYFDSAMRHMNKYMMGMTDEDHLAAACWNLLAIMHHEELNQKDLDDLPHYLNNSLIKEDIRQDLEELEKERMEEHIKIHEEISKDLKNEVKELGGYQE